MPNKTDWEAQGPYCDICGAHMGELYNEKTGKWRNPHNYNEYGNNTCSRCGQKYAYEEGNRIVLSKKQLQRLRTG